MAKLWSGFKNAIKPVGKFLHDAGAVAFGETVVKDVGQAAVDKVKGTVLDAEGKRNQLFQRLVALGPKANNILRWHALTSAKVKRSERLVVDGKIIPEYKFVELLASWTPGTHPRKIDDFLKLLNDCTRQEFCNYLALKWNNVLSQQFENTFHWLKINREALGDDNKVKDLIKRAGTKAKEAGRKTVKVVKNQSAEFEKNIRQKAEQINMDNEIQGDL